MDGPTVRGGACEDRVVVNAARLNEIIIDLIVEAIRVYREKHVNDPIDRCA